VLRTRFDERDAQFSPDGTLIAYHSNESGQHEVYVQPFPKGEPVRISISGGV
jgi:Tol biopolymer transport system component